MTPEDRERIERDLESKVDGALVLSGVRGLLTTSALAAMIAFSLWAAAYGLWLALGAFWWGIGCVLAVSYWDRLLARFGHPSPRCDAQQLRDGCAWCFQPLVMRTDRDRGMHFRCKFERDTGEKLQ